MNPLLQLQIWFKDMLREKKAQKYVQNQDLVRQFTMSGLGFNKQAACIKILKEWNSGNEKS